MLENSKEDDVKSLVDYRDKPQNVSEITPLEVNAICNILEDAIDQIIILGSIDSNSGENKVQLKIDDLKTRAEKFGKNDPMYNILNGELFTETINKMRYLKLTGDRTFLQEILIQAKNELFEKSNFQGIIEIVNDIHRAAQEEQTLLTNKTNNKIHASDLKKAVIDKKAVSLTEIQRVNVKISKYKDEIETLLFDNALKLRYVENWENARIEQGFMICDQNETELNETINKYKNEIEKEIRINAEIVAYIAENQKDIEDGVVNWMKRYDTELEDRQMEITKYKENRLEQKVRYESMLLMFDEHGKEIQDFLDYKERKRIKEELDALQLTSSIKIQAWWRGIMVRHQLGPFKPKPAEGTVPKGKPKPKKKK